MSRGSSSCGGIGSISSSKLASHLRVEVTICLYLPGTSTREIKRRMFTYITMNWRGQPMPLPQNNRAHFGHDTKSLKLRAVQESTGRCGQGDSERPRSGLSLARTPHLVLGNGATRYDQAKRSINRAVSVSTCLRGPGATEGTRRWINLLSL